MSSLPCVNVILKHDITGKDKQQRDRINDGRKEIFYLTTQSTYFYLRLYGVGHMVKSLRGLLFLISSKEYLNAPSHRQDGKYHGLC